MIKEIIDKVIANKNIKIYKDIFSFLDLLLKDFIFLENKWHVFL